MFQPRCLLQLCAAQEIQNRLGHNIFALLQKAQRHFERNKWTGAPFPQIQNNHCSIEHMEQPMCLLRLLTAPDIQQIWAPFLAL